MDGKKVIKRIIRDRVFHASESQCNIDQQINSHDYDNDPPPPKKKKNTSLTKGMNSLLVHY